MSEATEAHGLALVDPWLPRGPVPLGRPCVPFQVCRYDPDGEGDPFAVLDNVACADVREAVGTEVGVARLRYRFTGTDPAAPQSLEGALSTAIDTPKTIDLEDRIVVRALDPTGAWQPIFDGFALAFEGRLDPKQEEVRIVCVGVAKRCFDAPIPGAIIRDGNSPASPTNAAFGGPTPGPSDHRTDEVAHFNPRGVPNCIPGEFAESGTWGPPSAPSDDEKYPTFLLNEHPEEEEATPSNWTLSKGARYIIFAHNTQEFVGNPKGSDLDATLVARMPIDGVAFDPADPETYEARPIVAPDKPLTGKDWPTALYEMISARGFAQHWQVAGDGGAHNEPRTDLVIYDPQGREPKDLWLQPRGGALDPALSNVGAAEVGRDCIEVANRWEVAGEMTEHEVSVVLGLGFPCDPADAAATPTLRTFDMGDPSYVAANGSKYRDFILDESGEGHYLYGTDDEDRTPTSLDAVFGAPDTFEGRPVPRYAMRRRRPIGDLISKDARGRPLRARLCISTDFAPATDGDGNKAVPCLWDSSKAGSGTWQPVLHGWELLRDRIGIRLTCRNPNDWHIGKSDVVGHPFRPGVVRVVEALANDGSKPNKPLFYLRLTVRIRSDRRVRGTSGVALNSALNRIVTRTIDAHDRYKLQAIQPNSEFNPAADPIVARDDTDHAEAEAKATALVTQSGVLGGTVVIPRFTTYYKLGDRIRSIQGRSLGFRTDRDLGQSEPVYPVVIGRRFELDGQQRTILHLSDASTARHTYTTRARARHGTRYR